MATSAVAAAPRRAMNMRIVHMIDLVKRGYSLPETSLLRACWNGFGEDGAFHELLLIKELLVSRN